MHLVLTALRSHLSIIGRRQCPVYILVDLKSTIIGSGYSQKFGSFAYLRPIWNSIICDLQSTNGRLKSTGIARLESSVWIPRLLKEVWK